MLFGRIMIALIKRTNSEQLLFICNLLNKQGRREGGSKPQGALPTLHYGVSAAPRPLGNFFAIFLLARLALSPLGRTFLPQTSSRESPVGLEQRITSPQQSLWRPSPSLSLPSGVGASSAGHLPWPRPGHGRRRASAAPPRSCPSLWAARGRPSAQGHPRVRGAGPLPGALEAL
jgi:hypothetical protein